MMSQESAAQESVSNDNAFRGLLDNAPFVGDELIQSINHYYAEKGGRKAHIFNEASGALPGSAYTVHYLSDNGGLDDDLAKKEIKSRFLAYRKKISALAEESPPEWAYDDVPAQDSIAGAFDLSQLARDPQRDPGDIIFLNCAPRKRQRGEGEKNLGESVYTGMLPNGTVIAAVGEESFTFFRDQIENGELELYKANVQLDGSQFRSRDYFPLYSLVLTHQLRRKENEGVSWEKNMSLEDRRDLLSSLGSVDTDHVLALEDIPSPLENARVVRVDTHGNLKFNIRAADLDPALLSEPVTIEINGMEKNVQLGESMFDVGGDKFSFSEGSTGIWPDFKRAHRDDAGELIKWDVDDKGFLQLALIGGDAAKYFGIDKYALRSEEGVSVSIHSTLEVDPEPEPEVVPEGEEQDRQLA